MVASCCGREFYVFQKYGPVPMSTLRIIHVGKQTDKQNEGESNDMRSNCQRRALSREFRSPGIKQKVEEM